MSTAELRYPSSIFLALAAVTLAGAVAVDGPIALAIMHTHGTLLHAIALQITKLALGAHWIVLGFIITSFATLLLRKKDRPSQEMLRNLQRWAIHLLFAMAVTGVIVLLMKFVLGRARPSAWKPDGGALQFIPFNFSPSHQSFPSGHSQVIFCVAVLISQLWPRHRLLIFAAALLIALTRVLLLQHFVSDVVMGMWLGIFGAQWSVSFLNASVPAPKTFRTAFR